MNDLGEPVYDGSDYDKVLEEKEQLETRLRKLDEEAKRNERELLARLSEVEAERDKLDHLHKLDHSLADQWMARAEKAEEVINLIASCEKHADGDVVDIARIFLTNAQH